jgi:hypothetical protein
MSLKNKIIAICPLISVAIFLVLGFAPDFGFAPKPLWHPGWVIFFLTPVVTTLFNMRHDRFMIAVSVTLLYLIIGFVFSKWHPGWIIFLLIPILNILVKPRNKNFFRFTINKQNQDNSNSQE